MAWTFPSCKRGRVVRMCGRWVAGQPVTRVSWAPPAVPRGAGHASHALGAHVLCAVSHSRQRLVVVLGKHSPVCRQDASAMGLLAAAAIWGGGGHLQQVHPTDTCANGHH